MKRLIDAGKKAAFEARGKKLAAARLAMIEQAKSDATLGWDASPITHRARCAPRSMRRSRTRTGRWSAIASASPGRIGCGTSRSRISGTAARAAPASATTLPASLGAALANKKHGRLTVAFGGDGDFMFNPGTLWTAAHHQIPMLYIVHNNRAYHQECMYLQAMANAARPRHREHRRSAPRIKDPNVDYATVARGIGVHGEGPISDPNDLAAALKRAIAAVKSGQPALVDVVTDPR